MLNYNEQTNASSIIRLQNYCFFQFGKKLKSIRISAQIINEISITNIFVTKFFVMDYEFC